MRFSRQEYCRGLPCPPPGGPPNPGIEPMSPVSPALAGGFFMTELPGKPRLASVIFAYSLCISALAFPKFSIKILKFLTGI